MLALFGVLIYAGVRIAMRAPDMFGRLLAPASVLARVQALVNLGAVTGLLPITGVPLPLRSYGGSSLIVSMAAIGVLLDGRAGRRSRTARRGERRRPRPAKTPRAAPPERSAPAAAGA